MKTGYQTDLAYIHDVGFGAFAREATVEILNLLRARQIKNGRVIDLGCGSGILAQGLSSAGYDVLGVDLSPAMIALAQRKAPAAKFKLASLWRVKLLPSDVIISIGECLNYQFEQHDLAAMTDLFARIHASLRYGGIFLCDVLGLGSSATATKSYLTGKDWAVFLAKSEDKSARQLTRQMTIFRKVGNLYRRSEESHTVQLYNSSEIASALRQVGFRVQIVRGYGAMKFRRGLTGFIATKTQ